jgi:2,3-bisphosphoglycerate-dependent phosphoglycerate mutase
MSERLLVLVRHGQSEWNLKNLFTGWKDVELTETGVNEARAAGKKLKARNLTFDRAFTSDLKRAQNTLSLILEEMGQSVIPVTRNVALNERDYGDLVGMNKDDARKKWGEEQVLQWRRSYDIPPPGGESLKETRSPARCPITCRRFCRLSCAASARLSPRTAIRSARSLWCWSA